MIYGITVVLLNSLLSCGNFVHLYGKVFSNVRALPHSNGKVGPGSFGVLMPQHRRMLEQKGRRGWLGRRAPSERQRGGERGQVWDGGCWEEVTRK